MGKYDRYVQVPATGGGKYDKYLLVGQEREKTYGRAGSALIGAQQGQSMGGRDEAAGISAADKDAAVRAGLPEWLVKGADFYNKTNPMTAITSGVANFARGVGLEAQDQSGPKNLTELIADGAPTDPYREQYYAKRNEERAKSQTAAEDNPASYALGNIAGAASVAPLPALGVGKTVLGTAAKVGLEGAAFGGAYGFADSDGNIGDRATGGAVGAAIGGTAGAVLGPAAKYVIAPVFKAVGYKAFTSADNKALDMVLRRAERSGTSLDQVRADFEAWSKTGEVPETLAEFMGPNERGLLSALVTANSGTRAKAGEVLLERGKGEVDRLESAFAKSMGSAGGDFPKVRADAQKARAEDPEAFYKAAHFDQQGQRRFLDPKQTEALSYEIGGSRVAQGSLADAAGYADALGERAVRDEIDAFGKTLASGKKTEKLSVQAADYIERSINRRYGSATQGQVQDIPAGLRSLRDRIRGVIDDTGLGDARATAAERIRRQELLDEGRGFLKPGVDVEDINNTLRGNPKLDIAPASPEGQKAFTVGAARGISDKLRNTADMKGFADAARGIARTPAIREKVAAVRPQKLTKKGLPSKAAKQTRLNQELDQAIERTADRADFTNEMLGNSRTAFRQADMADAGFDDTLAQGIGDVTSELLARGPAAAQANMWQKAAKGAGNYIARPGIMNPKINDAAARVLLAQGDAIPEQLQRLAARQLKRGGPKLKIGAPSAGKGPVRGAGMLAGARGDLASGAAGGAIGSRQGDTPEERRANAAMGFASGIAAKRGAQGLLRAASRPLAREVTRATRMASEAIESIPKPSRPGQPMTGAEADDLLTARLNEVLAKNRVDPRDFYAGTAKIDQKKFAPMQEAERLVLEDMKALGYGPPADAEWLRAIRTFSPEQYNKWQATGARDMVSKFRQVQGKEMTPEIPPFEGPRVIDSPGRSMVKPRPSNDTKSSGVAALRGDASNALAGGAVGAAAPADNNRDRARNALIGAGGAVAGARAFPGVRGAVSKAPKGPKPYELDQFNSLGAQETRWDAMLGREKDWPAREKLARQLLRQYPERWEALYNVWPTRPDGSSSIKGVTPIMDMIKEEVPGYLFKARRAPEKGAALRQKAIDALDKRAQDLRPRLASSGGELVNQTDNALLLTDIVPSRPKAGGISGGKPPKIKSDIPLGTAPKGKLKLPKSLDDMMAEPVPMQGIAKATGHSSTIGKVAKREAEDMMRSGKTATEIHKKTGLVPLEIGGKRVLINVEGGASVDEVLTAFYVGKSLPRNEQPKWVQELIDDFDPLVLKDGKKPLVLDRPLKGSVRGAGLIAIGATGAAATQTLPDRNAKGQFVAAEAR